MAFKHGVYWSEVPTSILSPRTAEASMAVVVGTAPLFKAMDGAGNVNKPIICHTYADAVRLLGYSDDWQKWSLCEVMYTHFRLSAVAPVVFINVYDPEDIDMVTPVPAAALPVVNNRVILEAEAIPNTVIVKSEDGLTTYVLGVDYTLSWNTSGELLISVVPSGDIPSAATALSVAYSKANPGVITAADIIGGVDVNTGAETGLELVGAVFPKFRLTPGILLAPNWSSVPMVAAIMAAKANNINTVFKCVAYLDAPDTVGFQDIASWKNLNNYIDPMQYVCWPKVNLDDKVFNLSSVAAGVTAQTDASSSPDGIPFVSPSNQIARINGAVQDGTPMLLGLGQANYLNDNGITTVLNWIGGWRVWGNRTGAWPDNTDPKDYFLALRRMINWVGNSIVLTFWNKVDAPIRKLLIDNILDTVNIWFNGLKSSNYIIDGELLFREEDNNIQSLMGGQVIFHVRICPFSPAEHIEFVIEYDPAYLSQLFGGS